MQNQPQSNPSHANPNEKASEKASGASRPKDVQLSKTGTPLRVETIPVRVELELPELLKKLYSLAKSNMAWTWNANLHRQLEQWFPERWKQCDRNLLRFMSSASVDRLNRVMSNPDMMATLEHTLGELEALERERVQHPEIAYFCMEYGLAHPLRIYSGGLGILAGDHLKTASDLKMPLCAIGLAYRHGYFTQTLTHEGQQIANPSSNDFDSLPLNPVLNKDGSRLRFQVRFPGRMVQVQAWKTHVGRVPLMLLDTSLPENTPEDQSLTNHLYGGDTQHRLEQEILLGVGGYWLLKSLDLMPHVFHLNEGHAAFLVWARMIDLIHDKGLSFDEALEYVYQTSVFTTHTPVPAGHDKFSDDLIRPYLEIYAGELKTSVDEVSRLGKLLKENIHGVFSMTDLALRGSSFVNGVSQIHGQVARRMFQEVYPGLHDHEVPIRGITNGVHLGTWLAAEWQDLYQQRLGSRWVERVDPRDARLILDAMGPKQIWDLHMGMKRRLIEYVRDNIRHTYPARGESPAATAAAVANCNERALLVGFARRFAPYKRATLLFHDLKRLASLVNSGYPVVFLFGGKAHPHDKGGQELIRQVIEISRKPEFAGRVIFLEGYEMDLARHLVQGCDVWLNTPTRPLEASGTSGMKAAINGVLNLSVDDGWWSECYNGKNGWLVADSAMDENPDFQLEYDSTQIYSLLESDVIPSFFDRNGDGLPNRWIEMMRESIFTSIWDFSTARMLGDYQHHFLTKARRSSESLAKEGFANLKKLNQRRENIYRHWDEVRILKFESNVQPGVVKKAGESVECRAEIQHPGIEGKELLVQVVVGRDDGKGFWETFETSDLQLVESDAAKRVSYWKGQAAFRSTGSNDVTLRVLPKLESDAAKRRVFMHLARWL